MKQQRKKGGRNKNNTPFREQGLEHLSESEYRNRLIATALADAGSKEQRKRLLEEAPKLPAGRRVKLDYQNQLQREARGRMLRYLRKQHLGLTQVEFAMLVGTNRSYVGQVEAGIIDISCAALDLWCSRAGGRLMIVPF